MTMRIGLVTAVGLIVGVSVGSVLSQQRLPADLMERFRSLSTRAETEGLADSFVGVTTSDGPVSGLFPIRSTGVSTEPVRAAAEGFLVSLSQAQRDKTVFPVDDPEWLVRTPNGNDYGKVLRQHYRTHSHDSQP